jgi:hypothetical protein
MNRKYQSLFEAYVEYCFAPKRTVSEQLLDVWRDIRERNRSGVAGQVEDGPDPEWEHRAGEARPVYPPSGCTLCRCPERNLVSPHARLHRQAAAGNSEMAYAALADGGPRWALKPAQRADFMKSSVKRKREIPERAGGCGRIQRLRAGMRSYARRPQH